MRQIHFIRIFTAILSLTLLNLPVYAEDEGNISLTISAEYLYEATQDFIYTVSFENVPETASYFLVNAEGDIESTRIGTEPITIVLKDQEQAVFKGLSTETVCTVTEEEVSDVHTSYAVDEKSLDYADSVQIKFDHGKSVSLSFLHFREYSIEICKQNEAGEALSGAVLQIFKERDSKNPVAEWTSAAASEKVTLTAGNYVLHEVRPPTGYSAVSDLSFQVAANGKISGGQADSKENVDRLIAVNQRISELPSSGSSSMAAYLGICLAGLMICAGILVKSHKAV
jgi:hypothetical protein